MGNPICICGHDHNSHTKIKSVNYSAGKCSQCDCEYFIINSEHWIKYNNEKSKIREIIAEAIADMRGFRNGVPKIKNVLEFLPENLKKEVFEDADNILKELNKQGFIISKSK